VENTERCVPTRNMMTSGILLRNRVLTLSVDVEEEKSARGQGGFELETFPPEHQHRTPRPHNYQMITIRLIYVLLVFFNHEQRHCPPLPVKFRILHQWAL
jgi:hypothetical protein